MERSTPSTITKGEELFVVATPRMSVSMFSAPNSPSLIIMESPGILPANPVTILEVGVLTISAASMEEIAATTLSFFCWP